MRLGGYNHLIYNDVSSAGHRPDFRVHRFDAPGLEPLDLLSLMPPYFISWHEPRGLHPPGHEVFSSSNVWNKLGSEACKLTVFPMDSKAGTNGHNSILKVDWMRSTLEAWNSDVFHWAEAGILSPDMF